MNKRLLAQVLLALMTLLGSLAGLSNMFAQITHMTAFQFFISSTAVMTISRGLILTGDAASLFVYGIVMYFVSALITGLTFGVVFYIFFPES